MEYRNTKNANGHAEYDMRDPEQRKGGIRVLLAFFIPVILFGVPGTICIVNERIFAAVVFIFLAVFAAMYGMITMVIKNKEDEDIGDTSADDIYNFKVIRSVVVCIMLCATFIPFINYIYARISAKQFPESEIYGKGMNMQMFTLIWSFMSIFCIGLIVLLWSLGVF